jgi:hypothetical protein
MCNRRFPRASHRDEMIGCPIDDLPDCLTRAEEAFNETVLRDSE